MRHPAHIGSRFKLCVLPYNLARIVRVFHGKIILIRCKADVINAFADRRYLLRILGEFIGVNIQLRRAIDDRVVRGVDAVRGGINIDLTAEDADISALIALIGNIAVRGLDAVAAARDEHDIARLNADAVVALKCVVDASDGKVQILDLKVILAVNAVVVLRLDGQASLSTHLHIAFNVKSARMNTLRARIDRLAQIVNKVCRILFRRQREFIAAVDHDGRLGIALNKRALKHQLEFILTCVDDNIPAQVALYRIDRIGCKSRKGQNSIFKSVRIRRTLGTNDLQIGFNILLDVLKTDVAHFGSFTDHRVIRRGNDIGSARGKHQQQRQ